MESYFKVSLVLVASFALAIHAGTIATSNESSSNESGTDEGMQEQIQEFLAEIHGTCRNKTGNDDAFNILVNHVTYAPTCFAMRMDIDGFARDRSNLSNSTRVEFFNTYCPQINRSLSCMDPIVSTFRKCLNEEEIVLLDIVLGAVPEALKLICKDKGETFFNSDGKYKQCYENMIRPENCFNKISNATEAINLANYDEKQCNEVAEVRSCLQSQADECGTPRWVEMFDIFYRPMMRASPCTKYMQLDGNTTANQEEDNRIEANDI